MKGSNRHPAFKKGFFLLITIVAVSLLTCSLAFAGREEMTKEVVNDLILKTINFSILAFALIYFIKKPLKNFLSSRRSNFENTLKESDSSVKEATKEYKDTEKRVGELSKEIEAITSKMRQEGELEKERIIKQAQEAATKMKAQMEENIRREFELVQKKIKEETIEQTIKSTEEVLKSKIKPSDQESAAQKIADEILKVKEMDIFLQNPISSGLKKKVPLEIDPNKKVSKITMDMIKVLLASDDDKRKYIKDIAKAYEKYVSEITATAKAEVYSASDLSEAALVKITASLKKAIGRDIEVDVVKDPLLVGGIVTKIGSLVFDASIKTQLVNMKENLKKEVA